MQQNLLAGPAPRLCGSEYLATFISPNEVLLVLSFFFALPGLNELALLGSGGAEAVERT